MQRLDNARNILTNTLFKQKKNILDVFTVKTAVKPNKFPKAVLSNLVLKKSPTSPQWGHYRDGYRLDFILLVPFMVLQKGRIKLIFFYIEAAHRHDNGLFLEDCKRHSDPPGC